MTEQDKKQFGELWIAMMENYRATVTPTGLRMAFEALKPVLTIAECQRAAMEYMSDPDVTFPPKTNDIVARVKGTKQQRDDAATARAELAWVSLLAGRDKVTDVVGIAVMRGMQGVDKFALDRSTVKEVDFKRREFIANYLAYHHPDAADVLAQVPHAREALQHIDRERDQGAIAIVQKATALALASKGGQ